MERKDNMVVDYRGVPRVLHCFGGMGLGGAETFAMHAYRSIDRDRLQFDFAVSAQESCYYDDEIRRLGGRVIRHTAPSEAGFRIYGRELRKILQQFGPFCAIHSHLSYFTGEVLRIAASEGVPVRIAHMHSTRDARSGTLPGFAYHFCMRRLIRRFATHIFGCSGEVLAVAFGERWAADSRMSVVRNGIDLTPYSAPRQAAHDLRQRLSLPAEGNILGHIGNLTAPKNHRFLIETFRQYRKGDSQATLVLVGEGKLRPEIERQLEACSLGGHVRLLGRRPQSEIPDLLSAFDVLIMPSVYEGLPVSLIEAQAAGIPCVVSDVITRETDLGLGLLQFVGLHDAPASWISSIEAALRTTRPNLTIRLEALGIHGYNITDASGTLSRIYQGCRLSEPTVLR